MSSKHKTKPAAPKTKPAQPSAQPLKTWPIALAIAAFGFLLYANTLGHSYVLDDFSVIKENFVTKRGFEGIPDLWSHHSRYGYWNSSGELYRPIPMTMFAVEWAIMPDTPALGHFLNVLLYALTGGLLYSLLCRWFSGCHALLPLLATLFFMAHPTHVEVVANIKSRDEIVMFLLAVLSLHFLWNYLQFNKLWGLLLAIPCYLLACFSKENAVTFVAIVPLAAYFFSRAELSRTLLATAVYAACAGLFVVVRGQVIGDLVNPGDTSVLDNFLAGAKGGDYSASAFLVLGKYLLTLFVPHPLCSDFGYNQIPVTSWGDWRVLLSLAAWAGLGVFAVLRLLKKDIWGFAILFFFINFSIFTNLLVPIGTSYGDRLLYSASPGFALGLALLLLKVFGQDPAHASGQGLGSMFQNKALLAVAAVVLALYSLKTFDRNMDWKDSYSLYEADVETAPNSAKLNYHFGLEIAQKGLKETADAAKKPFFDRARQHFETAIRIFPSYHDAYAQLGLIFYREKNYDKALENYGLALKYKPNFPLVYSNMGTIYLERGETAKALEVYQRAVELDPRMVDALRNLGALNAMQRNWPEAIRWFAEALKYAPEDPTINLFLGSAYRDAGQADKGQPFLEKAYRLDPKLRK